MKRSTLVSAAAALALSATIGQAQTTQQSQQAPAKKSQTRDQIYGSQMMTQAERNEYRDRMRGAKSQQERDQIRSEHHSKMQERAKERGVTLPEAPPARRSGKGGGPGPEAGKGMGRGPGGGAGPGPGYGPGMGGGPGSGAGAK